MIKRRRFTFRTLKAGQARAYGPTRHEVECFVECSDSEDGDDWRPHPELNETIVQDQARAFSPWEDPDPDAEDKMGG